MKNEMRAPGKAVDVFMLLAEEADGMMKATTESTRNEASEETEKFLQEYEQKARQIILRSRENARIKATEIAERFKEALMLRIEEASAAALGQIITGVGNKTEEMVLRLQQAAQTEVRQVLADALANNQPAKQPAPVEAVPVESSEAANTESFESWLTQ